MDPYIWGMEAQTGDLRRLVSHQQCALAKSKVVLKSGSFMAPLPFPEATVRPW